MNHSADQNFPAVIPFLFLGFWLFACVLTGWISGWYTLMQEFPDREDSVLLQLKGQFGTMGGTNMNGILNISVCESGLRIGMLRIFGPFCRSFFVPWDRIHVERKKRMWGKTAMIQFGSPQVGALNLSTRLADRLARASQGKWPEPGAFPAETKSEVMRSMVMLWAAATAVAALFLTVVPRIAAPNESEYPPIALCIALPAIVAGIVSVAGYFLRIRRGL